MLNEQYDMNSGFRSEIYTRDMYLGAVSLQMVFKALRLDGIISGLSVVRKEKTSKD
jgi:hypothetical protein